MNAPATDKQIITSTRLASGDFADSDMIKNHPDELIVIIWLGAGIFKRWESGKYPANIFQCKGPSGREHEKNTEKVYVMRGVLFAPESKQGVRIRPPASPLNSGHPIIP